MGLFDDGDDDDNGKKKKGKKEERSYTLSELKELAKIFRSTPKRKKKD